MKLLITLAAASGLASHVLAQSASATPLVFTYQTLSSGSVAFTSTTYSVAAVSTVSSNASGSSYSVNTANFAYPTYSAVPSELMYGPQGTGLLNATQFAQEALKLVFFLKVANSTNCQTCKDTMSTVVASMKIQQELLSNIAEAFCKPLSTFLPLPICEGLLRVTSTDIGGIFPAMDMQGVDGQTLCAFMFGLCTLPSPPPVNTTALFKNTTKPNKIDPIPSGKEPLKVLHISDYHLDQRYVAGSEADCGGAVCCRVYPYTNISAPIKEPASIFGNYQCDTPEPLATSVFRSVPNATGYQWSDFSFGIFTGDLVSHDLWELTEEYVLSEELSSYQHFFNGLGGVPMYPTLGNHDTFPHAFAAFPEQNTSLPYNASYVVQQLYNYENVSNAWENYGWINASTAQSVVTSGLGIYRALTKEGLVIISLNSDIWYYFNLYAYIDANNADPTGMFATLVDWLLEAERNDQAVWLIQHVNVGGSTTYESLPAPTDLYYQIVDRFSFTIRGIFFGHTHEDEFGVYYANNATVKSESAAVGVGYIMPSVTTYQNLNAGFRYYLVDPDTFQIMDSITYYANVSETNQWAATGEVNWQFEYSARKTWDQNNSLADNEPLTPAFWHRVTEDIANYGLAYITYTDLRTKKYRPYTYDTAAERNYTLCGLTSMSIPIFEDCLGSMMSITSFL